MDDVTNVINKIERNKVEVMERLYIPKSLLVEIEEKYSTDSEKSHAYVDYYVHIHADASWGHLTEALWHNKEFAAARVSKVFMSTGKYC